METLKDDGQSRDFDKVDRKIYFEAQNAPYYGAWGAAQNRAMDLARQLPPGQAQELREIVAQLFEGMDEYAGMRFARGYHIGAAGEMEGRGIPGAEAHGQRFRPEPVAGLARISAPDVPGKVLRRVARNDRGQRVLARNGQGFGRDRAGVGVDVDRRSHGLAFFRKIPVYGTAA